MKSYTASMSTGKGHGQGVEYALDPAPGAILSFAEAIFGLGSIARTADYQMNRFFDLASRHFEELNAMMSTTGQKKFRTLWNKWSKARQQTSGDLRPVYASDDAINALVELLSRYVKNDNDHPAKAGIIVARLKSQTLPGEQANRAVIVSAASALEALLGNLVHALILKAPGTVSEGPQFSVGQLLGFATIAEAIEDAVQRKVADLVGRGGLRDWTDWFQRKAPIGIDMASLALDWSSTQEVFKRRNAIVHTNSRVNRDYRRGIENAPVEGTELNTPGWYVNQALENVLTLGVLIGLKTWLWLDQPREYLWYALIASVADDMADNEMQRGAERVYRHLRNHVDSHELRLRGQLRELQIRRENIYDENENETVSEEKYADAVQSWDVAGAGDEWAFRKAILLRDLENAFRLLPGLLAAGTIDRHELSRNEYWELRRDDQFDAMVGPVGLITSSRYRWS
jgi:hypothetical protein